jgi:hypothetical protein
LGRPGEGVGGERVGEPVETLDARLGYLDDNFIADVFHKFLKPF